MIRWLSEKSRRLLETEPEVLLWELEDQRPLSADQLFELAAAYDYLGKYAAARQNLKRALALDISHVLSHYGMGLLALESPQKNLAVRYLQRALRMDPRAAENTKIFQQALRARLSAPEASQWSLWALEHLHQLKKESESCRFEYAKLLFERSKFAEAADFFYALVKNKDYAFESTQYLTYIYEKLYRGPDLIERSLDLANIVEDKSDIFFNLAMVTQAELKDPELALHFFFLASQFEPADPGLKFSLEQACVDLIGEWGRTHDPRKQLGLFFCHLYHGSVALAERYAKILRENRDWKFPDHFQSLQPARLWQEWLLRDELPLRDHLVRWFGSDQVPTWRRLQIPRDQDGLQ